MKKKGDTGEKKEREKTNQGGVKCTTRGNQTLDKMYCNVNDGYRVVKKPSLGKSDHNMLFAIPTYKQLLKREKCTNIIVRDWNKQTEKRLQGCFDCTDWSVLHDASGGVDLNVNVLSSYISFCVDVIVATRVVKAYPNNKPWITKDVKLLVNEKKRLMNPRDRDQLRALQKRIDRKISDEKKVYKNKVEALFKSNRSKEAWRGLKMLCSSKSKKATVEPDNINYIEKY